MTHHYYCWITCLIPHYQDPIVSGMVKKGYMIGAADQNGQVLCSAGRSASSLLAFSTYKMANPEDLNATQVYDDLIKILTELNAYYTSVIVSQSSDTTWCGANFDTPSKEDPIALPPIPDKKLN